MQTFVTNLYRRLSQAFNSHYLINPQAFNEALARSISENHALEMIGYRPGAWYGPAVSAQIGTSAVVGGAGGAANSPLYATPIAIRQRVRITRLALIIGTSVAGNAKLSIYSHDWANHGPGLRMAQCPAAVSTAGTAGDVLATDVENGGINVEPGILWFVSKFSANAQPVTFQAGGVGVGGLAAILGQANAGGLVRNVGSVQTTRVQSGVNDDYNLDFPVSFPSPTWGTNVPGTPYVAFQAANSTAP